MDVHSKKVRSFNMSKISSVGTFPERVIQQFLQDLGLDFYTNVQEIEGRPDILIPVINVAIFVNGCFWHCHNKCKYFKTPASNQVFWQKKLYNNRLRDKRNYKKLKDQNMKILIVWECEIKSGKYFDKILKFLLKIS